MPTLVFNSQERCLDNIIIEIKTKTRKDYLNLLQFIQTSRQLIENKHYKNPFVWPNLKQMTLRIRYDDLVKDEQFPDDSPRSDHQSSTTLDQSKKIKVPTDEIISPEMCLTLANRLGHSPWLRTYIAGESREKRKIPVLEAFLPLANYPSRARLITAKPTLYCSGRQHANEVSATNYILKLAELIANEKAYQEFLKKVNVVLHPLENPDGAALAYSLQELTPHHSLHAGRYSSLGLDIGYQVQVNAPILPEAKVRPAIFAKWLPDIYLNLHGYPSHEWVQQFSGYSPYLFRDYWIPRGWFAYLQGLRLPLYQPWQKATERVMELIIEELTKDTQIKQSNQKFYGRYFRWASRWQPHLNYLEIYDGINLYIKRRSSRARLLSPRSKITFIQETPEVMDETAQGKWLDFLCQQGLAYLRAHLRFLAETK